MAAPAGLNAIVIGGTGATGVGLVGILLKAKVSWLGVKPVDAPS